MDDTTRRIAAAAAQIIARKERDGQIPLCATLREIVDLITDLPYDTVRDAMRQLLIDGMYDGSTTINKVPMLIKRTT